MLTNDNKLCSSQPSHDTVNAIESPYPEQNQIQKKIISNKKDQYHNDIQFQFQHQILNGTPDQKQYQIQDATQYQQHQIQYTSPGQKQYQIQNSPQYQPHQIQYTTPNQKQYQLYDEMGYLDITNQNQNQNSTQNQHQILNATQDSQNWENTDHSKILHMEDQPLINPQIEHSTQDQNQMQNGSLNNEHYFDMQIKMEVQQHPPIENEGYVDGSMDWKCIQCTASFKIQSSLKKHVRQAHVKTHRCPKCSKEFGNRLWAKNHMKTCQMQNLISISGINRWECDLCENQYSKKAYLIEHVLGKHSQKFKCPNCLKDFSSKHNLLRHSTLKTKCKPDQSESTTTNPTMEQNQFPNSKTRNKPKLGEEGTKSLLNCTMQRQSKIKFKMNPEVNMLTCALCSKVFSKRLQVLQHCIQFHKSQASSSNASYMLNQSNLSVSDMSLTSDQSSLAFSNDEGNFSHEDLSYQSNQSSTAESHLNNNLSYISNQSNTPQANGYRVNSSSVDSNLSPPPKTNIMDYDTELISSFQRASLYDKQNESQRNEPKTAIHKCQQCVRYFSSANLLKKHMNGMHLLTFSCRMCSLSFNVRQQLEQHLKICRIDNKYQNIQTLTKKGSKLHDDPNHRKTITAFETRSTFIHEHPLNLSLNPKVQLTLNTQLSVQHDVQTHQKTTAMETLISMRNINQQMMLKNSSQMYNTNGKSTLQLPFKQNTAMSESQMNVNESQNLLESDGNVNRRQELTTFKDDSFESVNTSNSKFYDTNSDASIPQTETKVIQVMPLTCNMCKDVFFTLDLLKMHEEQHHPNKFPCSHCFRQFSRKEALQKHFDSKHSSTRFQCDQCTQSFKCKYRLEDHIKGIHDKSQSFKCTTCNQVFALKFSLYSHKSSVHGNSEWKCQKCPIIYKQNYKLKLHIMRAHSGSENSNELFSCSRCDDSFANADLLRQHMMNNHKNEPWQCKHCPIVYKNKDNLAKHILKTHSGPEQNNDAFDCERCDETFSNVHLYHRHNGSAHKNQQWPCKQCSNVYASKNSLKLHIPRCPMIKKIVPTFY